MKYLILILYALVLIAIAIFTYKKIKSTHDFFLGGRRIGPWMSAFAYGTSYFSAVIFIGYAGQYGWDFGLASSWVGIGNAILGSLMPWIILGKRTRRMTQQLQASTMPEFFGSRYDSRALKVFTAVVIFIFLVPYSASVYQGLAYLFEQLFGIPFIWCTLIMVVVTAAYLIAGGYLATAVSDFFQGIIMLVGIVLIVGYVLANPMVGGLSGAVERLSSVDPALASLTGPKGVWPLVSIVLLTSLGTWGMPQMTHKFYAIRDEKSILRGTIISTCFALVVAGGSYFLGGFTRLFTQGMNTMPIDPVTGAANPSLLMPQMLASALPGAMIGVVLVLVLAASMSTLSSLALSASSSIGIDLIKGFLCPNMKDRSVKLLMKVLCGLFVVASFILANRRNTLISTMMSLSWGCLSGAFLGPYLLGLYWQGVTRAGAWSGIVGGLACCLVLNTSLVPVTPATAAVVAMGVGLVLTWAVSLVTPKLPRDFTAPILDAVRNQSVAQTNEAQQL